MNRGEMRAMLKDLLQEPAGDANIDQFSLVKLNTLLNRGALAIEMKVLRINPDAFLAVDTQALTANTNIYPVPSGCIAVRKVIRTRDGKRLGKRSDGYMDATFGFSVGSSLVPATVGLIMAQSPTDWSPFGRYVRVGPTPSETLANGLSITYIPSLTMAVDADVSQLVEGLHDAIVNKAWCLGLRPNADVSQKAAAFKALEESLEDFDDLAGVSTDGAIQFMPDFDPIDGFYGDTLGTANDAETR